MKNIFLIVFLLSTALSANASTPDTTIVNPHPSVLVVPYMPAMHLSDADIDISQGSEMEIPEMRATLRRGIIKELNKEFAEVYDVKGLKNDFVKDDNDDISSLYHSVVFERDSVYTLKDPARFAIKDTVPVKKGAPKKPKPEWQYINSKIYDEGLISDLSKKYNTDYFIFLNEMDIKTHSEDCINLALKIYRRDLKVHYTIFDRNGKQVYGDVAVSNFDSNSNDVNDIMKKNFPSISAYILASLDKVAKQ
jgi:hypothetical protein